MKALSIPLSPNTDVPIHVRRNLTRWSHSPLTSRVVVKLPAGAPVDETLAHVAMRLGVEFEVGVDCEVIVMVEP